MLARATEAPLPDNVAALQALVADLSARLAERDRAVTARDRIINTLKGQLAALRRRTFGQRSEKLARAADQLELQIEDLEQHQAEQTAPEAAAARPAATLEGEPAGGRNRPIRKPLPGHLPRAAEDLTPPYRAWAGRGSPTSAVSGWRGSARVPPSRPSSRP